MLFSFASESEIKSEDVRNSYNPFTDIKVKYIPVKS